MLMKKYLNEDKKAKSQSFFLKTETIVLNKKFINFLEKKYKFHKKDIRICLHKNPKSNHHDMVILQQNKNFYLPHKHLIKGETYHVIKGKMACVLFNNLGKVKLVCTLNKNDIFRTPINTIHTMLPISKYVIYHESKIGPFLKKNDSIFPKWTKKFINNKSEIYKFKKRIIDRI